MKILIAEHAGYCYGVQRALNMAKQVASSGNIKIFTLGPIIHNPQVVESLREMGIEPISSLDEADHGVIIIRTHGVGPGVIAQATKKGLTIEDATCPFVKKVQQRAAQLVAEGYELIVVGETEHPEVQAILEHASGSAHIIDGQDGIDALGEMVSSQRIGVVTQTTQPLSRLQSVVSQLLPIAEEIKIFNTICNATSKRQEAAREIARDADVMIVIGGKNSANTSRLADICRDEHTPTHHIETAAELEPTWFAGNGIVGVTAGASTPDWIMDEVIRRISELTNS